MAIVTLSESVLGRLPGKPGAVFRDRVLCGLCLKVGRRTKTFFVATSVGGQQVRVTLGRWPLITVDEARAMALPILRQCRAGELPAVRVRAKLPTLREALTQYADAKKVKPSSLARYESVLKTHFTDWQHKPVSALKEHAFGEHCRAFAQSKGASLVELGRALIGSVIRFIRAVYGVEISNPFVRLAGAGLLPARAQARERKLEEAGLPAWARAVGSLPERQSDYLRLMLLTGLRKNECAALRRRDVDIDSGVVMFPETKTGKPHNLPITPHMLGILSRRCQGLQEGDRLFDGFSVDHIADVAVRAGAPAFTLHDLRKMLATVGARLQVGDAVLRRILNHSAKRSDVLHRHYVRLSVTDLVDPLEHIQNVLGEMLLAK
jgi:integrase